MAGERARYPDWTADFREAASTWWAWRTLAADSPSSRRSATHSWITSGSIWASGWIQRWMCVRRRDAYSACVFSLRWTVVLTTDLPNPRNARCRGSGRPHVAPLQLKIPPSARRVERDIVMLSRMRVMRTMLAYSLAGWCCSDSGQDLACPVQEVLDCGLRDPMQEGPVENPSD